MVPPTPAALSSLLFLELTDQATATAYTRPECHSDLGLTVTISQNAAPPIAFPKTAHLIVPFLHSACFCLLATYHRPRKLQEAKTWPRSCTPRVCATENGRETAEGVAQ